MRPGLYGSIDATEAVEQNYNVSLSIDEAEENSIPFKEMGVSKCERVRDGTNSINQSRTLRGCRMGYGKNEKAGR